MDHGWIVEYVLKNKRNYWNWGLQGWIRNMVQRVMHGYVYVLLWAALTAHIHTYTYCCGLRLLDCRTAGDTHSGDRGGHSDEWANRRARRPRDLRLICFTIETSGPAVRRVWRFANRYLLSDGPTSSRFSSLINFFLTYFCLAILYMCTTSRAGTVFREALGEFDAMCPYVLRSYICMRVRGT